MDRNRLCTLYLSVLYLYSSLFILIDRNRLHALYSPFTLCGLDEQEQTMYSILYFMYASSTEAKLEMA